MFCPEPLIRYACCRASYDADPCAWPTLVLPAKIPTGVCAARTLHREAVATRRVTITTGFYYGYRSPSGRRVTVRMPEERVELSRGCPLRILSPVRLPFRHSGRRGI